MPLVILQYLYSLQIKGDSNKKKIIYGRFLVADIATDILTVNVVKSNNSILYLFINL
jgi:hypothetical protein